MLSLTPTPLTPSPEHSQLYSVASEKEKVQAAQKFKQNAMKVLLFLAGNTEVQTKKDPSRSSGRKFRSFYSDGDSW